MKLFTVIVAAALGFGTAAAADTTPPPATSAAPHGTAASKPTEAKTAEPAAALLFETYCAVCHLKTELPPDQMKASTAPPITVMAALYRQAAGADKTKYVGAMTAFLKVPTTEAALDQHAVQQFGLKKPVMEKFPQITDAELTSIVEWMWDHYPTTAATQATVAPTQAQTGATAPQSSGTPSAAIPVGTPGVGGGKMQQGNAQANQGSTLPANDSPIANAEGAHLFKKYCGDCHPKSDSPETGETPTQSPDKVKIEAPPMSMMAAHYRQVTGGDKNKYITRMLDFMRHPSADKSVDPRSIEHFGIKKPIDEQHPEVTDAEIATIAEWMWEYYKDVWIIRLPAHGVWGR